MDEGYDRSPGRRRSRSRSRSPVAAAAGTGTGAGASGSRRQRSASPGRRSKSYRRSSRSPSRERRRRRDDSPGYSSSRRRGGGDDDEAYPHSSTRGGYGGGSSSGRGGYRGGRGGSSYSSRGGDRDRGPRDDAPNRGSNREALAQEAIKTSKKENRVYVGNLSFQVRWHDLKEFCSSVGTVVFSEIITLPNGMSKGCGIVEFSTRPEAERAVRELNEGQLMGRPVFLREDREEDARYGSAAVSNRTNFPGSTFQTSGGGGGMGRDGHSSSRGGPPLAVPAVFAPPGPRGLFVTGMTDAIGWQDLKDLFRAAGQVVRADINIDHSTGASKGTGTVVMESKTEAEAAIAMFNGYEFDGGRLEVREDRFYHINAARGGLGGGRGRGGFSRGGFSGGRGGDSHMSSHSSSRNTDNLYGDYAGPDGSSGGMDTDQQGGSGYGSSRGGDYGGRGGFSGGRGGFSGGRGGYGGGPGAPERHVPRQAPPSTQIFVQNLPWSTANEDLIELFQTTGTVEHAEVLWENGRSRGSGVVQFSSIEEAETAIAKFQGYQYGGRPLGLAFNARWKEFGPAGASTGGGAVKDAAYGGTDAVELGGEATNGDRDMKEEEA